MREANDQDDVVSARLRVVLAAADHGVRDQQRSVPAAAVDDFTDLRPLKWTDLVPSWPDDVDLDPDDAPSPSALDPSEASIGSVSGAPAGLVSEAPARLVAAVSAGLPPNVATSAAESPPEGGRLPPGAGPEHDVGAEVGHGAGEQWRSMASEWESLESGSLLVEALKPALPESGPGLAETSAQPVARLGWAQVPPQPVPRAPQWSYPDSDDDALVDSVPALSGAGAFDAGRRGQKTAKTEGSGRLIAFDPGRRGVKALAVVAAVVVLIAAFLAWRARPRVDPVAAPPVEVAATTGRGDGSAGAQPPAAHPGSSGGAEVVVAVGGKVRKPGLVRLPPGSRVADALQAAGGATRGTDVAMLNLARKVVDGELIMVGVTPPPGAAAPNAPAGAAAGGAGAPPGGPINLNTATLADLDRLPGVGPVLAQRILDARDAQGGFKAVSDLRKVNGIGDARYEQLKDLVVV